MVGPPLEGADHRASCRRRRLHKSDVSLGVIWGQREKLFAVAACVCALPPSLPSHSHFYLCFFIIIIDLYRCNVRRASGTPSNDGNLRAPGVCEWVLRPRHAPSLMGNLGFKEKKRLKKQTLWKVTYELLSRLLVRFHISTDKRRAS